MHALAHMIGGDASRAHMLLGTVAHVHALWDGGNQWPGYPAWISFFRHIVQLPVDYSRWHYYEAAAMLGGPRVMHAQFCMISDRPCRLLVDAAHRPHAEDGPFCAWRDGTALWAWHGVRVPPRVILQPQTITLAEIEAERNAEVRRVLIERRGWDWWLAETRARLVGEDRFGRLYETALDGARFGVVLVANSTPEADGRRRTYALRVPSGYTSAHAAVAATFGCTPETYQPAIET
jgi:hypothetical protein